MLPRDLASSALLGWTEMTQQHFISERKVHDG